MGKDELGIQPGIHGMNPNSEIGQRLKQILVKINDHVEMKRIKLAGLLSPSETSAGLLPFDVFYLQMRNLDIADVSDVDIRFLAENYLKAIHSADLRGGQLVDYLKFLDDIKQYGSSSKSLTSLTTE